MRQQVMRHWYLPAALGILLLSPGASTDVVKLVPVELVYVYEQNQKICLETDTGDLGVGEDLEEAMADLRSSASGEIFLETANFAIVTEQTAHLVPGLHAFLRPATRICLGVRADAGAAEYLSAHEPQVTLKDLRTGEADLPVLIRTEGRYQLVSEPTS